MRGRNIIPLLYNLFSLRSNVRDVRILCEMVSTSSNLTKHSFYPKTIQMQIVVPEREHVPEILLWDHKGSLKIQKFDSAEWFGNFPEILSPFRVEREVGSFRSSSVQVSQAFLLRPVLSEDNRAARSLLTANFRKPLSTELVPKWKSKNTNFFTKQNQKTYLCYITHGHGHLW